DYWGEEIFRIEDKGQNVYAPRLSPDGNYLAYFSYDDKQADLWVVSLDGTYKKRLTDTPQYNEIFPVFSMEGKIVFTADYKGKYALYSTDINASNITLLLESPNPVIAFDWYYSPSCFDGTMNQDEVDIDCGGICGPCGTCFDGVKNQNEVGIDCGGVCPPCKVEERPLFFEQARNTMLISLLIFALVLLAAAYIFRKQISKYIGRLVDWILHRKFRHEFIDPEFKKSLLRRIAELEDSFNDLDFNDLVLAYTLIAREYFAKMADLSPEFDYSELHKQFEVLKIKGLLKKLLDDYADALNDIEFGKKNLSDILFRKHIEELRYLIVFTSQKNLDDLKRKEYKIMLESADDKFQDDFRQMLIALQFEEVLLAKKKYNALLRRYNFFSNQHKAKYYEDISKAYNYMRYVRLLL
ncbi:MAG: hypothetical protein KKG59_07010, partial [Nanoarchaeota archaeon]|nr:hypothetical protein [Nanoarchaeota archaeon]